MRRDRLGDAFALVVFLALAAILLRSGEFSEHSWLNHDVANSLYVAVRLLRGDVLYVDWAYYVMPSIVFLSAGAARVSGLLGLSPHSGIHLALLASGLLGTLVLRRSSREADPMAWVVRLAYLAVLVSAGLSPSDFAQREHFFVLLFVPYFFWRASGARASGLVCALLFSLAFVCMIKPHFVAAVALTELFWLDRAGDRLRVWASFLTGGLLPFALLALHSQAALEAFFARAVSYHLGDSYDAYQASLSLFLRTRTSTLLLALALAPPVLAGWVWRRGNQPGRVALATAVLSWFLYASFLQQQMFWHYHAMPLVGFSFVTGLALAANLAEIPGRAHLRSLLRIVPALLALLAICHGLLGLAATVRRPPPVGVRDLAPWLEGSGTIALLSPAVERGIFSWALRHDVELMRPWTSHYTVPAALALEDPRARAAALRAHFAPIVDRIRSERPDLVIFSSSNQAMPPFVTLHDVVVRELRLFPTAGYRLGGVTARGWRVYVRVPSWRTSLSTKHSGLPSPKYASSSSSRRGLVDSAGRDVR